MTEHELYASGQAFLCASMLTSVVLVSLGESYGLGVLQDSAEGPLLIVQIILGVIGFAHIFFWAKKK